MYYYIYDYYSAEENDGPETFILRTGIAYSNSDEPYENIRTFNPDQVYYENYAILGFPKGMVPPNKLEIK